MLNFWSQFEEAWRDTLVHKAEREALVRLARLYCFPWPQTEVSEVAWRGALHTEAYGLRGTLAATYWALEAALSDFNEILQVTGESGQNITAAPGTFTARHVNRLVRTRLGLHWSEGPEPFGDGSILHLSKYSTTYWDAFPDLDADTPLEAQILPFVLRERTPGAINDTDVSSPGESCRVEVEFYAQEVERFPAAYLRESHAIYRSSSSAMAFQPPSGPPLHHLNENDPIVFGVRGGGTLPSPLVAGTVYYVATITSTTRFSVSATPGGVIIQPLTGGTDTMLAMSSPASMPHSGHLLTNEQVDGNPAGFGPYPVYLNDGVLFYGVLSSLDRTLAAGVTPVIGWHPLLAHNVYTIRSLPPLF